ncbi:MAG: YCF48-related protein, partial [Bacteroidota bacterium]|nr:YCF48-related protein [Bacteroidota bacterium]
LNNNKGFAVGKEGIILRTVDGGKNWIPKSSGVNSYLHDITFTNKASGYIAGLSGTILKTNDGGDIWTQINPAPDASLFCISFLNTTTGVAGGYNTILKTTNGGRTFTKLNAGIDPSSAIVGISFIDSNTIYAAGNSPHGSFYKSTNGGKEWSNQTLALPYLFGGSVDLVRSMSFLDRSTGYIVTDFGTILKTSSGGNNWHMDSSFRPSYTKLSIMYDLSLTDSLHINISGAGGTIIRSTNAGRNWLVSAGNKKTLYKNYFINDATGFCVGESGTVLKTVDEGLTWDNLCKFTDKHLKAIYFGNDKRGYVAGNRGAIFKTTDLGITWTDQTHYLNLDYNDIHFRDDAVGIAAGGNPENGRAFIYKTTNGGTNWYEAYDSIGSGILNAITFVDNSNWLIAGNNGNILKTNDAGEHWESINLCYEDLNSIIFSDPKNGLVSGNDGIIYKTTDGGIVWRSKVSGTLASLNSIKYINSDHVIAAGDNGTLIISYDGGDLWSVVPKITNNNLFTVNRVNDRLFASGEYGTIITSKASRNILAASKNTNVINSHYTLHQNFPNPFNPETIINYELSRSADVMIRIHDLLGKEVAIISNQKQEAGNHSLKFNGSNLCGGIYFYSLVVNNTPAGTRTMIILK